MSRTMLSYEHGQSRFNYRIAGVAVEAGHVLLHRAEHDDFWALPGGRAELMEPARLTLAREMREEIGVAVEVGRLLWIVEGFWDSGGRTWHELSLLFQITLPAEAGRGPAIGAFDGQEEMGGGQPPLRLIYQWFPIAGLEAVSFHPAFLRTALRSLPSAPVHVVNDERGPAA